jgi:hypothetical protein
MSIDALGAEDTLVGQLFAERYRIEARLGEGGMGTVYRAHHTGLDCPVALKLLHPALTSDPVIARRFDREALALSKLDHPNCLRVLDAGTSPAGAKYIVMPLLAGQELRAMLDGPLPLARAVDLTVQILRGLEHAHRRGMIHRDLKPENVLVVTDDEGREQAKLVDFGIVKMLVEDAGVEPLTRVGLVFGTPRYMSPEQVSGGKITERTDLYAVGIILYEMLAGIAPFDADDAGMLMRMQILGDVPPLPDTVPPPLAEVVQRLLEKSPSDRYATAREVREALESAMLATPGRTVVASTGTDPLGATIGAAAGLGSAPTMARTPEPIGTAPTMARSPEPPVSAPARAPVPSVPAIAVAPPPASLAPVAPPARSYGRHAPVIAAALLALLGLVIIVALWPGETTPPPSATSPTTTPGLAATPAALPTAQAPAVADPPAGRTDAPVQRAPATTTAKRSSPVRSTKERSKGNGKGKGGKKHKFSKGGFSFEIDD